MSNNQQKIQGSQFRARSEGAYKPLIVPNIFTGAVKSAVERQESRGNQGMGCLYLLGIGVIGAGCLIAQVVQSVK